MDDDPMTGLKARVREAYVKTLYAAQAGSQATPRHLRLGLDLRRHLVAAARRAKLADLMLAEATRAARLAKATAAMEATNAKLA